MIAAIVPAAAFGNTLPLLAIDDAKIAVLILANLNSFAFDFLARQKVQGQHLNWYILEQIPVIAPAAYEAEIGGVRIADFIRNEVLALSYTAHDLVPFGRDLGYVDADGRVKPPFVWNAEDRAERMARLDALFFHHYGLSTAEADGAVLDGRDIGTVICPDAEVKLFVTASLEERTRRRLAELRARGEHISFEELQAQIAERDERDMTRKDSPLYQGADAHLLDTTALSIEAAAAAAYAIVE